MKRYIKFLFVLAGAITLSLHADCAHVCDLCGQEYSVVAEDDNAQMIFDDSDESQLVESDTDSQLSVCPDCEQKIFATWCKPNTALCKKSEQLLKRLQRNVLRTKTHFTKLKVAFDIVHNKAMVDVNKSKLNDNELYKSIKGLVKSDKVLFRSALKNADFCSKLSKKWHSYLENGFTQLNARRKRCDTKVNKLLSSTETGLSGLVHKFEALERVYAEVFHQASTTKETIDTQHEEQSAVSQQLTIRQGATTAAALLLDADSMAKRSQIADK